MLLKNEKMLILLLLTCITATLATYPKIQTTVYESAPAIWYTDIDARPFLKIGAKHYHIEDNKKLNWHDGAHYCRRIHMQLASIESFEEWENLSKYLISKNYTKSDYFWLSGNDLGKEGHFNWLGNGYPIKNGQWSVGQPDNRDNIEHCVQLWRDKDQFMFNDENCAVEILFICEANSPKTIAITVWPN